MWCEQQKVWFPCLTFRSSPILYRCGTEKLILFLRLYRNKAQHFNNVSLLLRRKGLINVLFRSFSNAPPTKVVKVGFFFVFTHAPRQFICLWWNTAHRHGVTDDIILVKSLVAIIFNLHSMPFHNISYNLPYPSYHCLGPLHRQEPS